MAEELPPRLKIEVKTSRSGAFQVSERDLKGVRPDGHAAILITSRRLKGPRWILVQAGRLKIGSHDEKSLIQAEKDGDSPDKVVAAINQAWSDWILDEKVRRILFEQKNVQPKDAIEWCLQSHPARKNKFSGAVREGKLEQALKQFRSELDAFLDTDRGPQQEGQVHQYILGDAIARLGYDVTNNPVGVPDIDAVLRTAGSEPGGQTLKERLEQWRAGTEPLKRVRQQLLELDDDELEQLGKILAPRPRD